MIFRSVLAVICGYLVFGLSAALLFQVSGVDPHQRASFGFMFFSLAYGLVFAVLAGFVAARLAPRNAMLHTSVVAGIVALAATASLFSMPQAVWTQLATLLLFTPATLLGGWFVHNKASHNATKTR